MPNFKSAMATVAVSDIKAAKKFYGGTLSLSAEEENEHFVSYKVGDSSLLVYVSEYAGSNKATSSSFQVDDIVSATKELAESGVAFEHYPDMPGAVIEGDVHVMEGQKAAWFKDPSGNILALNEN